MARPMSSGILSPRRLAGSTVWNLGGQALPVVAALIAVPMLIRDLGLDRFGLLSLVWLLIGYFSLFDLGLGWALTRVIAQRLAARRDEEIPGLVWTALLLLLALGAVGTLVVVAATPWLVGEALRIPGDLESEAAGAFRVLAATLPFVTGTAALAGVLSAHQRFGPLNAIRSPLGAFSFLGPLLVTPFTTDLTAVALVLAAGRLVGWVAHLLVSLRVVPGLRRGVAISYSSLGPLLGFGGWMTVSAVVGPFMVYLDRFIVGALLSLAMVAYYATPYDLVSRLWVLSGPVVGVLFPAFAGTRETDPPRSARLYGWGLRAVLVALFPGALLASLFAHELLTLWLGRPFADASATVLRLLAVGVFVNGLAQVSLAYVQSAGQPAWAARLHLIELPLYLAAMWLVVPTFGIGGAAAVWVGRASVDALALGARADRLAGPRPGRWTTHLLIAAGVGAMIGGGMIPGPVPRLAYAAAISIAFGGFAWVMVARPARALLSR